MKATAALTILFIAVLWGGYYLAHQNSSTYSVSNTSNSDTSGTGTTSGYTMTDVAAHAGMGSCWTAINGSVYDLTNWVTQHPGGEGTILSICGRDGTSAFSGQHGRDPRAESILATFKIGSLAS